jgi:hypothetical protein
VIELGLDFPFIPIPPFQQTHTGTLPPHTCALPRLQLTLSIMKELQAKATETHPTTPAKRLASSVLQNANTPGGFQLFDFVDGLQGSPFVNKTSSSLRTPPPNIRRTPDKTPFTTPRNNREWHECSLSIDSNFLHLIDWSIKSRIELQGQPTSVLFDVIDDARLQQQAMRQFVSDHSIDRTVKATTSDQSARIDWNSSLHYWQHPAIYPINEELSNSSQLSKSEDSRLLHLRDGKDNNAKGDARMKDGWLDKALPPKNKRQRRALHDTAAEAQISSNGKSFLSIRRREWQEALRSMYMNWIDRVQSLDELWKREGQSTAYENDNFMKLITDSYFYARGSSGHTILFRVGLATDNTDRFVANETERTDISLVPEIVISASTAALRKNLSALGIETMPLDRRTKVDSEKGGASLDAQENSPCDGDDASPNVKAELVALRRAQVLGKAAGVDVTVSIRPNNGKKQNESQIFPLVLSGMDNCAAFVELYRNTFGHLEKGQGLQSARASEMNPDVPLLLCRKLGPFIHAAVKMVVVRNQNSVHSSDESAMCQSASIHLSGYILPCALRDLFCASAALMLANAQSNPPLADQSIDDDVGSHHVVVRAFQLSDDKDSRLESYCTRADGSQNGPWSVVKSAPFLDADTLSCQSDEELTLAVWDITRPNTVAFKLDNKFLA